MPNDKMAAKHQLTAKYVYSRRKRNGKDRLIDDYSIGSARHERVVCVQWSASSILPLSLAQILSQFYANHDIAARIDLISISVDNVDGAGFDYPV